MQSVSILGAANVQCSMAIMPSVSILGAANVQWSMFNGQWSTVNVQ